MGSPVLPVGVLRCRRAAQMVGDTPSTTPSTTHRLKITEGSFAANSAWLVFAAIAFNLTRAGGTIASVFHAKATTATIRRQLIAVPARLARSARRNQGLQWKSWTDRRLPHVSIANTGSESCSPTREYLTGGSGLSRERHIALSTLMSRYDDSTICLIIYSACRMARAQMVKVGFSDPLVGNTLPSAINKLGTS